MAGADDSPSLPVDLPRALTDSSTLIAACLSARGSAHEVLDAGESGHVQLIVSAYILAETERSLYRKAPHGLRAFWDHRAHLLVVNPPPELVADVADSVESKDAPIVAAAIAAQATFLLTYDRRHLLSHADTVRRTFGVEVIEPAAFLVRIGRR